MNPRYRFFEHKGQQILLLDYSKLQGQEYVDFSRSIIGETLAIGQQDMFLLIDATDSLISREVSEVHKEITEKTQHLFKHIAFVGMDPLRRILSNMALSIVTKKIRFFQTREEAQDWLVQVAGK